MTLFLWLVTNRSVKFRSMLLRGTYYKTRDKIFHHKQWNNKKLRHYDDAFVSRCKNSFHFCLSLVDLVSENFHAQTIGGGCQKELTVFFFC